MSTHTKILFPVLGALLALSCGPATPEPPDELAELKREVLAQLANEVILPTLTTFEQQAMALETATAALATDPSADHRAAAQLAWREAMETWEQAEMMQLGPQGMSGVAGVTGGENLRDEIYSWPVTSLCQIDTRTAAETRGDTGAVGAELVNVRGLDALEYVLFVETTENDCTSVSPLNAEGTWDALGEDGVRAARAEYAHTLAQLVVTEASALRGLWAGDGGFATELATAGDGSGTFSSAQAALDDLAGALLYLDNEARDMKLGESAGLTEGCPTETCPEALESRFSRTSREHLLANVRGFSLVFHGGAPDDASAPGLDDLLVEVGQAQLAADIGASIAASITALEDIGAPLEEAITTMAAAVEAAYDAIGVTQRLFKVDVVSVLDLAPSSAAASDDD